MLPLQAPPVRPSTANCSISYHTQPLDHFSYTENRTFAQRVFTHDSYWRPGGPILFYCGNEASVELYVNATGWMWERAAAFGALLVWAEHRYYGKTQPFGSPSSGSGNASTLQWLTLEQALADYATLLHALKAERGAPASTKVIALGGSYGGMLAAWLRMHYPSAVDAALAASAPVLAFEGLVHPGVAFDGNAFWRVVTRDASPAAGAHQDCVPAVRATWSAIDAAATSAAGRAQLASIFQLCGPLTDARHAATASGQRRANAPPAGTPSPQGSGAARLKALLLNVFDTLAMGNFPYASNYLVFQQTRDPSVMLPAWPMRAACAKFAGASATDPPLTLMLRMAAAAGVLYNASAAARCYELPASALDGGDGIWDWQYCTQRMPQESYFNLTGTSDMFWRYAKSDADIAAHCAARYPGIVQRPGWIAATSAFGAASTASNIIFSNGELSPWHNLPVARSPHSPWFTEDLYPSSISHQANSTHGAAAACCATCRARWSPSRCRRAPTTST